MDSELLFLLCMKQKKKYSLQHLSLIFLLSLNPTVFAFSLSKLNSQFSSWGIQAHNSKSNINLAGAWQNFQQKKEIVIAVIDTGIDPHHPFLKDNIYTYRGTVKRENNYGIDFSLRRKSLFTPMDKHGHGTHVSGIIKSVFPSVKILSLKYYDSQASGEANLNSTIEALKYAVSKNIHIINYSGGGPEASSEELRILKQAEEKGILVVAAAGNEQSNIDKPTNAYYPASYNLSNIITVAAHDQNLKILSSSNWGFKSVDLIAPGGHIKSALPHRRTGYLTGTSQATAFVSGAAALLMAQFPLLKAYEVKEILNLSVRKHPLFRTKCSSGGRLDVSRAQAYAREYLKKKKRNLANGKDKSLKVQKKSYYHLSQ